MGDEFTTTEICGGAWWNSPKSVISPAEICLSPCSMGFGTDLAPISFSYTDMKSRLSCTDNITTSCGNNSNAFGHKLQREIDSDSGGSTITIDSTLQMMGLGFITSSSSDLNDSILQEDLNSSLMGNTSSHDHCHGFLSAPSSSSSSSSLLQSFYEIESNNSLMNNNCPISNNLMMSLTSCSENPQLHWSKNESLLLQSTSSSMIPSSTQLTNYGFNTNIPFLNSSNPNLNNITTNSFVTSPPITTNFEDKPLNGHNNITPKRSSSCGEAAKKANDEASMKKPRITTSSQLPTFKVRKENLRDQITALQQLVSPFGKTDTASVLQEAIEYIKFLHDQVSVLCTPYLKQDTLTPQQQQFNDKTKEPQGNDSQDLKRRGLCLVPISSTFPVANETSVDFWTPTFGGNNLR